MVVTCQALALGIAYWMRSSSPAGTNLRAEAALILASNHQPIRRTTNNPARICTLRFFEGRYFRRFSTEAIMLHAFLCARGLFASASELASNRFRESVFELAAEPVLQLG